MPEIAEVARVVHFIRQHLVGRTIASATAQEDDKVFGAVGTSASAYETALRGKTIVGAGQQGKYFWLELSSPPHPLMHFGMTGWLHLRGVHTYYYRDEQHEPGEWPPRFWKFRLTTEPDADGETVEAAFVDSRRFGRARLVDCDAKQIRMVSPLKENGPDPVVDKGLVTREWVRRLCGSKRVPIKALLLDQANISGIGNWVGDEVLYYAKIHPEQYSNTLKKDQVTNLHESIHHICSTACELNGESDKFPKSWLFRHRWGKGKKGEPSQLPNGEKIIFLTVGGRTSAVVPSVQKKTGFVTKALEDGTEDKKAAKQTEKLAKPVKKDDESAAESNGVKAEEPNEPPSTNKRKAERKVESTAKKPKPQVEGAAPTPVASGRRRSERNSGK